MEFIELVDNIFGKFQTNYLNNLNVVYIQNVVYDFLGNRTIIPDLSDTDFFITIEEWELLKKKISMFIEIFTLSDDEYTDPIKYTFQYKHFHITFHLENYESIIIILLSRLMLSGYEEGYQLTIPTASWNVFQENLSNLFYKNVEIYL